MIVSETGTLPAILKDAKEVSYARKPRMWWSSCDLQLRTRLVLASCYQADMGAANGRLGKASLSTTMA